MAKFNLKSFEKSKFDKEPPGVKEGSKADKALDKKQMAAANRAPAFKKGGKKK